MPSKIHPLFPSVANDQIAVAIVVEARNGQATMVHRGNTPGPVAGHLSQVEPLKTGDRVLTVRTDMGLIVAGRLRGPDESCAPRIEEMDGCLLLKGTHSVRLQAGENRIEVHADGRIELDGRQISGMAEGRLRLQGSSIELN